MKLKMGKRGDVLQKGVVARQVRFLLLYAVVSGIHGLMILGQRGTTITLTNIFTPLPVRRKEFERNVKREFGKAMALLTGYALVPCAVSPATAPTATSSDDDDNNSAIKSTCKGVRLTVTNTISAGKKQTHTLSPGSGSTTLAISQALWGSKALEGVKDFYLDLSVEGPKPRGRVSSSEASQDVKLVI